MTCDFLGKFSRAYILMRVKREKFIFPFCDVWLRIEGDMEKSLLMCNSKAILRRFFC